MNEKEIRKILKEETEIPDNIDVDAMVSVTDCGVTYRGYIKDVDFKFAKAESVKYNLIVKSIEH